MRIAGFYTIKLRRTYAKSLNTLKKEINFSKGRKTKRFKNAALRKLRSFVNMNSPEVLDDQDIIEFFENAYKAINQKKNDKNKIYSILEP